VPEGLFRFYRATTGHHDGKKGGASLSRTVEAAAAFRSARKSSHRMTQNGPRAGCNQVGFYELLRDAERQIERKRERERERERYGKCRDEAFSVREKNVA